jgi:hypothetical protein
MIEDVQKVLEYGMTLQELSLQIQVVTDEKNKMASRLSEMISMSEHESLLNQLRQAYDGKLQTKQQESDKYLEDGRHGEEKLRDKQAECDKHTFDLHHSEERLKEEQMHHTRVVQELTEAKAQVEKMVPMDVHLNVSQEFEQVKRELDSSKKELYNVSLELDDVKKDYFQSQTAHDPNLEKQLQQLQAKHAMCEKERSATKDKYNQELNKIQLKLRMANDEKNSLEKQISDLSAKNSQQKDRSDVARTESRQTQTHGESYEEARMQFRQEQPHRQTLLEQPLRETRREQPIREIRQEHLLREARQDQGLMVTHEAPKYRKELPKPDSFASYQFPTYQDELSEEEVDGSMLAEMIEDNKVPLTSLASSQREAHKKKKKTPEPTPKSVKSVKRKSETENTQSKRVKHVHKMETVRLKVFLLTLPDQFYCRLFQLKPTKAQVWFQVPKKAKGQGKSAWRDAQSRLVGRRVENIFNFHCNLVVDHFAKKSVCL